MIRITELNLPLFLLSFSIFIWFLRRSCHNRSVEICVKPQNCHQTWLFIYFFVFCRVKKKEGIAVEYFYYNHATFSISWRCPKINFTGRVWKHNNRNIPSSMTISRFNANFYTSIMTWSTHKTWNIFAFVLPK